MCRYCEVRGEINMECLKFKVNDLVKFRKAEGAHDFGQILAILEIIDSVNDKDRGIRIYKIQPLDGRLLAQDVGQEDIIEGYIKYF